MTAQQSSQTKTNSNKNKRFKTLITLLITVLFIFAVEYFIGWSEIISAWQKLSLETLLVATVLIFFSYGLRAIRIFSYFNMNSTQQFLLCVKTTLTHNFFNNLLPMRSGEISFPVLLHRYFNLGKIDSVVALLFFRILDLHVLAVIFAVSCLFLFPEYAWLLVITTIIWLALLFLSLLFRSRALDWLARRNSKKFYKTLTSILESFPASYRALCTSYLWTLVNWITKLAVFSWIIIQFYSMDFSIAMISVLFGDMTSVLPIHGVAGAGTYEAGILLGASLFNINAQDILPAAINLHLFILGASFLGVLVSYLIKFK